MPHRALVHRACAVRAGSPGRPSCDPPVRGLPGTPNSHAGGEAGPLARLAAPLLAPRGVEGGTQRVTATFICNTLDNTPP